MKIGFFPFIGSPTGGSEVLWLSAAEYALRHGDSVLIYSTRRDDFEAPIEHLRTLGAQIIYRRRPYPALATRARKHVINAVFPNKKVTYHDHLLKEKLDTLFFSLAAGDEIARDKDDLFVFIHKIRFPFSIFCHELWIDCSERGYHQRLIETFRCAKFVFFTSFHAAEHVERALDIRISNKRVLSHPVQSRDDLMLIPAVNSVIPRLCMLGTLQVNRKGQDIALRALAKEGIKRKEWVLDLYGDGPDRNYLTGLASELGLAARINVRGRADNVLEPINSNQLFLFPTLSDTGPITLLECLFAGRVVVANKIGLASDLLVDGTNGFLSSGFTVDSFYHALQRAFSTMARWPAIGYAARETAKAAYDPRPERTLVKILCLSQAEV